MTDSATRGQPLKVRARRGFLFVVLLGTARVAMGADAGIQLQEAVFVDVAPSDASYSVAFQDAGAEGDSIILAISFGPQTAHLSSITDDRGDRYTAALPPTLGTGFLACCEVQIFYATSIDAGAAPVTVTYSFADVGSLEINQTEYSGIEALDSVVTAVSSLSGTVDSGILVTHAANELVFAWLITGNTLDAGAGFRTVSAGGADLLEDEITGPPGSYLALASVDNAWDLQVATFRPLAPPSVGFDGGAVDAGSTTDAGTAGMQREAVGCDCSTSSGEATALLALGACLTQLHPSQRRRKPKTEV